MKKKTIVIAIIFSVILLGACMNTGRRDMAVQVIELYREDLTVLKKELALLVKLIESDAASVQIQEQFKEARSAYKKVEWFAEYYAPFTVKYINGPALEEVELDEKSVVIQPEGFQVLEEYLFPFLDPALKEDVLHEAKILYSNSGRLEQVAINLETTNAHIFDALRLEVFRIMTLGVSGFDSPVAQNSISEAASSLMGVETYYSVYEDRLERADKLLARKIHTLFEQGHRFLQENNDFASFDRMAFITNYLNPLSTYLFQAQQQLEFPFFNEPRALRTDARTLFSENVFNPDFFTSNTDAYSNSGKIDLGRKLFFDNKLSGDGTRSCATCHNPSKAFTDGLPKSKAFNGGFVERNAPTLIYAALQQSLFYDMRSAFLEDQAKDVIENKNELHGSLSGAAQKLSRDTDYMDLFRQAYAGRLDSVSSFHIQNALAAFIRSLTPFTSKFDRHMRGGKTMDVEEIEGFNIFMGKAKCGTCHFMPLFNGTVPPAFTVSESEVIGVPGNKHLSKVDADMGRYNIHKISKHLSAFKTPTLRNVQLTAPYMHNGVFATLDEVVDFYDAGGAAGQNVILENQTLPADSLHLSTEEKRKLILFMNTLTD
jgi:cytochrome c peroxidase